MFKKLSTKNILLIFLTMIVVVTLIILTGKPSETPINNSNSDDGVNESITFQTAMQNADRLESVRYTLNDSSIEKHDYFMIRQKFGKVILETPLEKNGNKYDHVYFDRVKKVALARCSEDLCEYNKELITVNYSDFYVSDPVETSYLTKDVEYSHSEMLGNQYVDIFNATTYNDEPAIITAQEYYGIPLKYTIGDRTIIYEDLMVNNVRLGEIMLPMNCTIDGEQYDFGWYSYYSNNYNETLLYN